VGKGMSLERHPLRGASIYRKGPTPHTKYLVLHTHIHTPRIFQRLEQIDTERGADRNGFAQTHLHHGRNLVAQDPRGSAGLGHLETRCVVQRGAAPLPHPASEPARVWTFRDGCGGVAATTAHTAVAQPHRPPAGQGHHAHRAHRRTLAHSRPRSR